MNNSAIQYLLQEWDATIANICRQDLTQLNSRRCFLKQIFVGSTAILFSNAVLANSNKLDSHTWKTFSAVHLHLFPSSDNEPDAQTINATAFLKSVIEWPDFDQSDKKFIIDGAGWLDGISNEKYQQSFYLLKSSEQKENVLRTIEKSKAGKRWLSLILLYLFESLLTDPVYGGNRDGKGWRWLEHQPGFPRPPASKRYFNL